MNLKVFIKKLLVVIGAGLLVGCGSSLKKMEGETLLPEIDVVQVKEYSEEALKLAQEAKIDVQMINTKISDIDNKLMVLTEEVSSVSLAKIEELENRLSLLIEAFKDLHEQMASIEVLPQVRVGKKKVYDLDRSFQALVIGNIEKYPVLGKCSIQGYKRFLFDGGIFPQVPGDQVGIGMYGLPEAPVYDTVFKEMKGGGRMIIEESVKHCKDLRIKQRHVTTKEIFIVECNMTGIKMKRELSIENRFQVDVPVTLLFPHGKPG